MTERVYATVFIERRTIGGGEDDPGSADSCAYCSGSHDAHPDRSGCLISRTGDDWSALAQSRDGRPAS